MSSSVMDQYDNVNSSPSSVSGQKSLEEHDKLSYCLNKLNMFIKYSVSYNNIKWFKIIVSIRRVIERRMLYWNRDTKKKDETKQRNKEKKLLHILADQDVYFRLVMRHRNNQQQ
jgi:hypothetical protein